MMTVTRGRSATALALSGCASIAVAFGFARYGFGLFVPAFETEFGLRTTTVGAIGSATYVAYLVALLGSGALTARRGPRSPVVVGNACALVGTALVAVATSPAVLVVGLVLAASSSGWVWAPFADAVVLRVEPDRRARALAVISTGTTFGLMIAGPLALLTGDRPDAWRIVWAIFAALSAATLVASLRVVPVRRPAANRESYARALRTVRNANGGDLPSATPLLLGAALYGAVGAGFYTFAVDLVRGEGLGVGWSSLLWLLVGIGGVSGVATGEAVRMIGLRGSFGAAIGLLAAGIVALAVLPSSAAGAGAAALLFGFAYMPTAALLTLWNQRVHSERPTTGMTVVLACMAAGSIVGPVGLGLVADAVGLRQGFLWLAVVTLLGLAFRPPSERGRASRELPAVAVAAGVTAGGERR